MAYLLALSAVLAACGGGGDSAAAPTPPAPPSVVAPGTWVVLGSSTARGVGASTGRAWVTQVASANAAKQVTVLNLAKASATSYGALPTSSRPPPDRPAADTSANLDRALAEQPRLLLLSFPTNDTASGYSPDETVNNLLALRQAAAAAGAATLVLGTQPRDAFSGAQNEQLHAIDQRLAQQLGPCFVPLRAALADAQGRLSAAFAAGDGVHLNDAGHTLVAQQVQAALETGRCVRLQAN